VKKVGEYAEQYYREITGKLGFFVQQWRGKIYIYDTKEDYLRDTRAPEWSIGLANYDTYSISSFVGAQGFMESVLPHEVGHIVFYVFMEGRGRDMPTCLHEGIAQYVERTESRRNFRTTVRVAVKKGIFIPLPGLFEVTSRQLLSMNEESVHVFYAEAVGVVDYLVAKHGSMNFAVFLQDLKEGNGFKPSMKWAFNYDTLSDMNDAWLKYLGP
jgi:hypothetical protein